MSPAQYAQFYQEALLENVIPFWVNHSPDPEYGGFFTCLDHKGDVYDTDKFIWLQCREVWTFSMLCEELGINETWLNLARQGGEFLRKHGRDDQGNWYFSLTREGKPLVQPYNIFSDCFAAMAFSRLYRLTGDEQHRQIATETFKNIITRQDHPKGKYEKSVPGIRPMQGLALPMILSNLVLEVEPLIDPDLMKKTINRSMELVMQVFYRPDQKVILEHVSKDGEFLDTFEGRMVNPGHGLESMWFMMDLAERLGDRKMIENATRISLELMDFGWDTLYGGLFYFMDVKGHPPDKLEWDQKLWWVHQEAMIAMLKAFLHTGNSDCWRWFEKLHNYSWNRFADPENGEWYGYLNRRGEILIPAKGGKWKGCFHTPRFLLKCWQTLVKIEENLPE